MAEKLDPKETVTFEELLMSNVIEQEALVNLLEKKGIITKTELLDEIKRLRGKRRRFRMKWPW
jgi:hypothetical protein